MPIHRGSFGGSVALAPTVSISAASNYNQAIATFNATVNPNGYTTSVKFQYSTNGSTWSDSGTVSGITGNSQSVYYNHNGSIAYLTENTLYYVRAIATNQIGSTTSSSTTFTTWSLKTYANGTPGTYSVDIPTVTPTGGSPIAMSLYYLFVVGGGGGAGYAGGGAGGYRLENSRTFSNGSNQTISVVVGSGGGAQAAGGSSSISGTYFGSTLTAGGGGGGSPAINGTGGALGSGDVSYSGGPGYVAVDKNGTPDYNYAAAGGGAGWGGNGGAARLYPFYGGDGAAGGGAHGYTGGAGGRGYGTESPNYGANGTYWFGYGSGGQAVNGGGQVGLVFFNYYGP